MPIVKVYSDLNNNGNTMDGSAMHLGNTNGSTWTTMRSSAVNGFLTDYNDPFNTVSVTRHNTGSNLFSQLIKSYLSFDLSPYAGKYINNIQFYNHFKTKNVQEDTAVRIVMWIANNQIGGWKVIERPDWEWDTGRDYGLYSNLLLATYPKDYLASINNDQLIVSLLDRTRVQPFMGYIFGMAIVLDCDWQNNPDLIPGGNGITTGYDFWSTDGYDTFRPYLQIDYSDAPPVSDSQIIMIV